MCPISRGEVVKEDRSSFTELGLGCFLASLKTQIRINQSENSRGLNFHVKSNSDNTKTLIFKVKHSSGREALLKNIESLRNYCSNVSKVILNLDNEESVYYFLEGI